MSHDELEPWDRRPGESAKAYEAFCLYRDMKPRERSLLKTYRQHVGKPHARLPASSYTRWSTDNEWVERAAAWDAHQDRERREAKLEAIREMEKLHAEVGREMLVVARAEVQKLGKRIERALTNQDEAARLKSVIPSKELASFVAIASRLERLSRGEPDNIQGVGGEGAMTYADLVLKSTRAAREGE